MRKKPAGTMRKIAAVLAGGLVLGIGAATTLAAWTDSQYATATFTAGIFKIESSINGTTWTDHTAGAPAQLTLSAAGMSPGVSSFGYLDVRTTDASTLGGTVLLQAATKGSSDPQDMIDALEFRAKALNAGQTCDAAALGSAAFVDVTASPVVTGSQSLSPKKANVVRYCLQTQMKTSAPSSIQGKTANLTWTVLGTSS
ncbi:SipW-dependent-type signal peptide-containing protein [Paeniglutamicibacter sp. NPDC091659]|uniref:SipW-dependent-type signal peptide-containing protein n=1 Tax=Paeniglutamicibacter sp. NPDC091659 TaxID=3364389 RepID=UPI003808C728